MTEATQQHQSNEGASAAGRNAKKTDQGSSSSNTQQALDAWRKMEGRLSEESATQLRKEVVEPFEQLLSGGAERPLECEIEQSMILLYWLDLQPLELKRADHQRELPELSCELARVLREQRRWLKWQPNAMHLLFNELLDIQKQIDLWSENNAEKLSTRNNGEESCLGLPNELRTWFPLCLAKAVKTQILEPAKCNRVLADLLRGIRRKRSKKKGDSSDGIENDPVVFAIKCLLKDGRGKEKDDPTHIAIAQDVLESCGKEWKIKHDTESKHIEPEQPKQQNEASVLEEKPRLVRAGIHIENSKKEKQTLLPRVVTRPHKLEPRADALRRLYHRLTDSQQGTNPTADQADALTAWSKSIREYLTRACPKTEFSLQPDGTQDYYRIWKLVQYMNLMRDQSVNHKDAEVDKLIEEFWTHTKSEDGFGLQTGPDSEGPPRGCPVILSLGLHDAVLKSPARVIWQKDPPLDLGAAVSGVRGMPQRGIERDPLLAFLYARQDVLLELCLDFGGEWEEDGLPDAMGRLFDGGTFAKEDALSLLNFCVRIWLRNSSKTNESEKARSVAESLFRVMTKQEKWFCSVVPSLVPKSTLQENDIPDACCIKWMQNSVLGQVTSSPDPSKYHLGDGERFQLRLGVGRELFEEESALVVCDPPEVPEGYDQNHPLSRLRASLQRVPWEFESSDRPFDEFIRKRVGKFCDGESSWLARFLQDVAQSGDETGALLQWWRILEPYLKETLHPRLIETKGDTSSISVAWDKDTRFPWDKVLWECSRKVGRFECCELESVRFASNPEDAEGRFSLGSDTPSMTSLKNFLDCCLKYRQCSGWEQPLKEILDIVSDWVRLLDVDAGPNTQASFLGKHGLLGVLDKLAELRKAAPDSHQQEFQELYATIATFLGSVELQIQPSQLPKTNAEIDGSETMAMTHQFHDHVPRGGLIELTLGCEGKEPASCTRSASVVYSYGEEPSSLNQLCELVGKYATKFPRAADLGKHLKQMQGKSPAQMSNVVEKMHELFYEWIPAYHEGYSMGQLGDTPDEKEAFELFRQLIRGLGFKETHKNSEESVDSDFDLVAHTKDGGHPPNSLVYPTLKKGTVCIRRGMYVRRM